MSREPPAAGAGADRALRLALAVAAGLTLEIARGAPLPPVAPVIALQLLALPGGPPRAGVVVGLVAVIGLSALAGWAVAAATAGRDGLYALGMALVYLWAFWLALGPRTAAAGALALTVSITVTLLGAGSTGLAAAVVGEVMVSVLVGLGLVYLAHALIPLRAGAAAPAGPRAAAGAAPPLPRGAHAAAATAVMLPLHLWFAAEGALAFVVLLTVATMLCQPDLARSARHGRAFLAGNLVGGLLAALAVAPVALQPGPAMLVAAGSAGAAAMAFLLAQMPGRAPVLLPGFVAYTLLFGLAFSGVAPTGAVALWQRLGLIAAAAAYAIGAIALVAPIVARRGARGA